MATEVGDVERVLDLLSRFEIGRHLMRDTHEDEPLPRWDHMGGRVILPTGNGGDGGKYVKAVLTGEVR